MFIRNLILITALFLLVSFQAAFMPVFTGFFPNLLLIVVLAFCWGGRKEGALWAAFLGGFFYDLLTVRPLGVRSLLLIMIVVLILHVRRRSDNLLFRFLSTLAVASGWYLYPYLGFSEVSTLLAVLDAFAAVILCPVLTLLFERLSWKEDLQLSFKLK